MNWNYFYNHYFGTLFLGPFVLQITMFMYDVNPNKIFSLLEFFPISLLFSLFFSAPTYLLYAFVYYYLAKKNVKIMCSKTLLNLLVVLGIIITTSLIKGSMMQDILISYSTTSVLLGLILNLNFKKNHHHQPQH